MARSPLTLAASVTSALPRVGVVSVAALTEDAAGRYDSAVATLEDGRKVVVRVPADEAADADLRAETRALAALSAGVRAVLPFAAPEVLGQARMDGVEAVVETFLPGYRVDAPHIPAGRGVATAVGAGIAAVHDLPAAVARDAGLPVLTAAQVRTEVERLLDRAEATGRLPFGLLRRWSQAIGSDALWRFETTVVLGGVDPAAFVLRDDEQGVPAVTGLLTWAGLGVGDPAVDLRWLSSAPDARDDVLAAYAARAHRAVDSVLAERARLHAELEFAAWLVHGHATGTESVIDDAVALLEALDANVRDEPPLAAEQITVDDAMAVLGRVPAGDGVDTSMQTDAFDPSMLAEYVDDAETTGDIETAPIELGSWTPQPTATGATGAAAADGVRAAAPDPDDADRDDDVDEAARNALRRWTGTD